jgi:hypothetical protein
VEDDITVDNETLLVIDFVNLKIKPTQSFGGAHKDSVCACVHKGEYSYVYKYLHLYCISKKIGEGVCCFCLQVMKYNKILWDILL